MGLCKSSQIVKVLMMNAYFDCKFPLNLQKLIKKDLVGSQIGVQ
jgi:hypothetical protein